MSNRHSRRQALLDSDTREATSDERQTRSSESLILTVVHHPDADRVGEEAQLDVSSRSSQLLSRVEPDFFMPGTTDGFPLADPFISVHSFFSV